MESSISTKEILTYTCSVFTRMRNILYCVTSLSIVCQSKEHSECKKLPAYSCCYNQYLNDENTCVECPSGSIGWNCKSPCPSAFYGRLCKFACECDASECHRVTGCITTIGPPSVTTSATDTASYHNPSTIATASSIGGGSSHPSIKPIKKNLHFHYEDDHDDHATPLSTLGFSVLGSLSSLCIIGCVLFIYSRKKKWKFRSSPNGSRIRQAFLPCVNEDRQQEVVQGSGDIELSNVNAVPVCGQEEDDSPYSEIRYSQFIGGANAGGACMNTSYNTMHKCDSDKHHCKSEKQNTYQKSINKNEYDHVKLKVKSSDMGSERNLSLTRYSDEEYVSLLSEQSLGKEVRPKDGLKCQNLTLSKHTSNDFTEMEKGEDKAYRLLTEYSLQKLEFEMEVEIDQLSEKTTHHFIDTDKQTGPQRDNRPYSMAGGLSETDLSKTVDLPNNTHSETKNLSDNDLSEVVADSVNQSDIDIPGKREDHDQTNTRPYSIAKIPEF